MALSVLRLTSGETRALIRLFRSMKFEELDALLKRVRSNAVRGAVDGFELPLFMPPSVEQHLARQITETAKSSGLSLGRFGTEMQAEFEELGLDVPRYTKDIGFRRWLSLLQGVLTASEIYQAAIRVADRRLDRGTKAWPLR